MSAREKKTLLFAIALTLLLDSLLWRAPPANFKREINSCLALQWLCRDFFSVLAQSMKVMQSYHRRLN
jgi:hypothetical protein